MRSTVKLLASAALLPVVALSACGGPSAGGDAEPSEGTELRGTITVLAATSLSPAFDEVAEGFVHEHPGVEVKVAYAGSSSLATQILEGAPAQAFASADRESMATVADEGLLAEEPAIFARNELVIVTEPGNPEGIEALDDLAGLGVVALCGEQVPCGRYAAAALHRAGVVIDESRITRGQNVGATLTAVTEGDAAAAVVYRTVAESAGSSVHVVELAGPGGDVLVDHAVAALAGGDEAIGKAFVDHLLGDDGQAVLRRHGFVPPP